MAKPAQKRRYAAVGPAGGAAAFLRHFDVPYDVWKRRAKQLGAGIAENTLVNAADPGQGYRPAFIDQILGLPGVVKSFTPSAGKGDKPFSGDTAIERQLNRSYKGMTTAELNANKLLGTSSAKNTEDLGYRYLLPSLLNPKGVLKAVPKGVRGAKAVEKVAKIAAKTPGYITKPAKVVAEFATPFRQTKLSTALPINAAVLGATDIAMDKGVTSDGQVYEGALPNIIRSATGRELNQAPADPEEAEAMNAIVQQELQDSIDNGEITEDEIADYDKTPFGPEEEAADVQNQWVEKAKDAGLLVTGILAATVGGHKFKNVARSFADARVKAINDPKNAFKFDDPDTYAPTSEIDVNTDVPPRSAVPDEPDVTPAGTEPHFIGTEYEKSDIGLADRAIGGAFEKTRPITTMAERFLGRNQAKKMGFRLDALTNSSIQSRFHDWLITGRAPGTEIKTESLAAWSRQFAKELTPDEQLRVGDALVAASSLDDFKRTGEHSSLFKDKYGNPADPAAKQALVDAVKQDPKLGKYYNQIQKFYDQKLQFEVERGTMTRADYDEMRKNRPNYVPLQGNLRQEAPYSPFTARYSANEDMQKARNLETETGVPGDEGVVNPLSQLFEQWSDAVRRADTNEFRRDFLGKMNAAGARNSKGQLIVKKLKPEQAGRNVHEVDTATGKERYDIIDSQLARSLHLSPRETVQFLEEARQMYQNYTTGALATGRNLFGVAAAPIMDSMAASSLAGKSHKVGLANRLFVGGHIGGIRASGDAIAREFAVRMRMKMISENSWLRDALNKLPGGDGAEKFTTMLENHYKNTTLAEMDKMGITSHAAWGASDPTHVMEGLEGVVPEFARQQSQHTIDELNRALDKGSIGQIAGRMSKINNQWTKTKAAPFVRQYMALLENMHNGARYSAVRANKGKVKDLDEFISDMRRLSADPSIHGSNKYVNYLASSNLYGPISLATMGQVGKRAREDPLNFLRNTSQTAATAAAMFYLSQYHDQEARDAHAAKTPQQKANKLSLFGGAELPLDQLNRLVLGSVLPITDQISGMNNGEWNEGFMDSMRKMIEGEGPHMDEAAWKDLEMRLNEAWRANMPSSLLTTGLNLKPDGAVGLDYKPDPSSVPPLAAIFSLMGVDPASSTLTGEVMGPRTQKISGFEPNQLKPDSLMNSFQETLARTLFSSAGAGVIDVASDAYRTYNDDDPNNHKTVAEVALDQWKEGAQKGAGIFKPLFGDRVQSKSAADVNYSLLKDREKGIENAVETYQRNLRTDTFSGASTSPGTAGVARELDPNTVRNRIDITGTKAAEIGASSQQVKSELDKKKVEVKAISAQVESIKASSDKTQAEKNKLINERVDEIKMQRMDMLRLVREHEQHLTKVLGRDFTFEDYNPEDWMDPYEPNQ